MDIVVYGAECGVDVGECVGPGGWFVTASWEGGEEDVVEIGIYDMEFVRANSYDGAI